ncbi:SnoaL-like domain-containing protein [Penicillium hordei]|uniref:SnoaL-like domain-containing protein n=1 Tax=Penicillium hordei TaxID=40994 RepID=A0AAD6DKP7_9EURO|nr:SnoaL-like domain-containing protein [Penicillium hordei]KAJ5588199.1 SnoaL-like domain-containing protein [Penicillium hordei]
MVATTTDHELIRNCISRYCIGVDLRDWEIFSRAFTNNVKVSFPAPAESTEGIAALTSSVQGMVGILQTQHALSTQVIELTGERTAEATTYVSAVLSGVGKNEGKFVTSWGMYQDKLVKDLFEGREDWRIAERIASSWLPLTGDLSLLSA